MIVSEKSKQSVANKKWEEKNRERSNYLKVRSTARSFIRNKASKEDLLELKSLIENRLEEIKDEFE